MARPPITDEELIARYGPHLNEAPPGGWDAGLQIDKVVNTHCCFCGQQCGIKLKVHDNAVVGFEPWYDFPFNEGKLCPKGVKRYLQGGHPDRLLHPMERDETAPGGFRNITWDQALDRVVSEIRRIQAEYGDDAFAMLSGVSLTNEKSYLVGKFARLALHTANLDYNGRYCMVSAGAGNKKALGVDRAPNPWSDIPLADVVWVAGSNVAETFPITTSYIWRARDRGAKLIVQDPRVVPLARTADLFLPVRPGTDSALFGAVLHILIERDWLDHDFIDAHTLDFDDAAAAVADMTPAWAAGITGVPAARIEEAAELWGTSATGMMLHARGIEQQTKGVDNVLAAINLGLATGKFGKPGCGVSTITGQGNGQGGREHGHKCDQLARQPRHHQPRAPCRTSRRCGTATSPRSRAKASRRRRSSRRSTTGRSRDCCRSASTRRSRRPTRTSPARRSTSSSSTRSSTSSSPNPATTPTSCCPGRCTRRTRAPRPAARDGSSRSTPPSPTRRGPPRLGDPARHRRTPGQERVLPVHEHRGDLRGALPGQHRRHRRLHRRHLATHRGRDGPVLADPRSGPSRHPRLYEGGKFFHPDGKARFHAVPFKLSAEVVDDDYPVWLTTGRVVSASTCRAPRPGASPRSSPSTRNRCARCTPSSPSRSASPTATSSPSPHGAAR